jgi:cell division initiation protein
MITPLDIENKKFNKQMMNGYNVEEVDEFLDEIQTDYEKNYKELATARTKIEELTVSLSHYKNIETTLQNTLVMAQSTAEEVKNVARQQSEQIISEAQKQSEELVRISKENSRKTLSELDDQVSKKEKELDDIKKQFDIYKAKMESLLISQLELIKEINKDE